MSDPVYQALAQAALQGEPVTLGIITGAKGSSPQKVGAKALFYGDGRIAGTLGGGCLEAEIQQRAIRCLRSGKPQIFDLLLDHDFGWDDGLICGGKVEGVIVPNAESAGETFWRNLAERKSAQTWGVTRSLAIRDAADASPDPSDWLYVERVRPPCCLWIAGAGHIAQAVAPLALKLDFQVTVFDDRPALLNTRLFPAEAELRAGAWEQLLKEPLPERPAFGLIVTRGHRHDALVLRQWIRRPFLFIGMIGSKRKARTIFEHFREEGLCTAQQLARVACPVGIPIRSRTVVEIAVSIGAQLIEKRAELVQESAPEDLHATEEAP